MKTALIIGTINAASVIATYLGVYVLSALALTMPKPVEGGSFGYSFLYTLVQIVSVNITEIMKRRCPEALSILPENHK